MKYEVTSYNTKKLFANALKKLVKEKSFSKVTVSDIIKECQVNRKTFYYHFENVYDLLTWTLEQEAIDVVKSFDLTIDYEEAILFAMDYIEKNDQFLNNIYHSIGRDELKRFFYNDFIEVTQSIITTVEKNENKQLPNTFKNFLGEFYTEALAGILVEWITKKQAMKKDELIAAIAYILRCSIPEIIKQY